MASVRRRAFLAVLACGLAAQPRRGRAQPAVPVVGFVNGGRPGPFAHLVTAFRQGLAETWKW